MSTADGRYDVPDPAARAAIMKLRSDPAVSAVMAGAFTRSNAAELAAAIGRQPTEGELYIAHFLGPDGASRLISAAATDPQRSAVAMFPQAAAANRSIFYDNFGRARSVRDVYGKVTGRFEAARNSTFATGLRGTIGAPGGRAPDTAGLTQALAQAAPRAPRVEFPADISEHVQRSGARRGEPDRERFVDAGLDRGAGGSAKRGGSTAQSFHQRAGQPALAVRGRLSRYGERFVKCRRLRLMRRCLSRVRWCHDRPSVSAVDPQCRAR